MPGEKVKPLPAITMQSNGSKEKSFLLCKTDKVVKIEKILQFPNTDLWFYGVFNLETGKAYHSVDERLSTSYVINLETTGPFESISLEEIYKEFEDKCSLAE